MKGIFYSIMIALFIIPILALIVFYSQAEVQNIDINIRSNELHYFSESVEKDLARFLEISGKRALISAVSEVVTNGIGLDDAQLRLSEMITNGTLYGNPAPLVDEKNLLTWEQNITDIASNLGFNIDLKNIELNITQNDSFNILFNTTIYVNISDEIANMGVLKNITASVAVSIEDIEDPIFPLKTFSRVFRFIKASNVNKNTTPLVTGQNASGLPPNFNFGYAFVISSTGLSSCNANLSRILVTDSLTDQQVNTVSSCFGGFVIRDNPIIPSALIGKAITGASDAMSIKNETKIYLDNAVPPKVWDLSNLTSDIKNGYYHNSTQGASFLDRLEGNITLSNKYKYGLETFVYKEDFPPGLFKDLNSVLDYEYWNNTLGTSIRNGNYDDIYNWFKVSPESANSYGVRLLQ
jgi:hypothetical protein